MPQVAERLNLKLSAEEVKNAETDAYIIRRLKATLAVLKNCATEARRIDLHVIVGAIAPERRGPRDQEGMIRRVAERLGLQRGSRHVKATGEKRPRVLEQAITRRAAFDEAESHSRGPLKAGDSATSRGRPCTVVEIDYEADTCKLAFEVAGVKLTRDYSCISKGRGEWQVAPGAVSSSKAWPKGSARLSHEPPSLRPAARETRKDEMAEKARPKVEELFDAEGARSPAIKDQVRRRVGPGLYQTAQALLIYSTYAALYALFVTQYPAIAISFSVFKALRPWYVRRAKQEGCLCKHCENFKCYQETLHSLPKLFESVVTPSSLDADDAGEDDDGELEIDEWAGKAGLLKLLEFCALRSKSDMMRKALCDGAYDGAGKQRCINGECSACGFGKLFWSKSLRSHVVDAHGNLKQDAPVEFSSQVKWKRIRSSNKTAPGEAKQPNYEVKTGTVIEFLDEFERDTMRKFPHHRFTILRQKAMAAEFERNRWPGWVQCDIDFAMDGDIPPPQGRAIQSEHWSPMGYTLFVQIVSWLETAAWKDRAGALCKGAAVTVEPADASMPNTTEPATGSFWAEIVSIPSTTTAPDDPERRVYGVRRYGAAEDAIEYSERRFLRHRKLHTKAFIHISDDKTHDSHAAQTFLKKSFDYLDEHYVQTGKEKFVAWHFHSDNAPSHFKSTKTMYFLTTLPARLASWASATFRIYWEFGAPGHGKGVWDGIGAWIKRTVRQDIVDDRPYVCWDSNCSLLTRCRRLIGFESSCCQASPYNYDRVRLHSLARRGC